MKRGYLNVALVLVVLASALIVVGNISLYESYSGVVTTVSAKASQSSEVSLFIEAELIVPPVVEPEFPTGGKSSDKPADFTVFPPEIEVELVTGEGGEEEVRVRNIGTDPLKIDVGLVGDISPFVGLNTNLLELEPGNEARIILSIAGPDAGIYTGKLLFDARSFDLRKEVPIIIEVRSPETIFDVSLTIPEEFRVITPGTNLKAFVSILQVGPDIEVNGTIDYIVKDFEGNILYTESESLAGLVGEEDFLKEFGTSQLEPGEYVAGIGVSYPGGVAVSSARFTVSRVDIPEVEDVVKAFLILWLIIFLVCLILRILRRKRREKK